MEQAVLRGSLSSFKLPQVLSFLNAARKTGTLTLSSDGRAASLFFQQGALVHASSNQERFRLGAILLRAGTISREQWQRVDARMGTEGGRFGELAIEYGLLTDAQLRDFLKVQVSEIAFDCFVWSGGEFAFAEDTSLPPYAVTIAIDLQNLIMEGARRIEEWEQCVAMLPDPAVVLRVVSRPKDDRVTLTSDEWKILFLINGTRTLEELTRDAGETPLHVYRVIVGLLGSRLIEPVLHDRGDDTGAGEQTAGPSQDETVRQVAPAFGFDSTVREAAGDDTSLLLSSEANLSYADVVKAILARLTVTSGETAGTSIPLLDAEYTVGRHRDNKVQLIDPGVSGFHARVFRGTDGYVVEDLKSRNGTWLNGSRVFHATLSHGDVLRLGNTDVVFEEV